MILQLFLQFSSSTDSLMYKKYLFDPNPHSRNSLVKYNTKDGQQWWLRMYLPSGNSKICTYGRSGGRNTTEVYCTILILSMINRFTYIVMINLGTNKRGGRCPQHSLSQITGSKVIKLANPKYCQTVQNVETTKCQSPKCWKDKVSLLGLNIKARALLSINPLGWAFLVQNCPSTS
jgi:hypothetical protein